MSPEDGTIMERDDYRDVSCKCTARYGASQENKVRGNWLLRPMSTIALMGAVLGLGNFWRFPYLMFAYSPVLLIPYIIFMVFLAVPLMYLGLSMGQFTSSGILTCWMIPIFKAVGVAMLCCVVPLTIYYNVFGAWSLYYMYESILAFFNGTPLPWTQVTAKGYGNPECSSRLKHYKPSLPLVTSCDEYVDSVPVSGVCWQTSSYRYGDSYSYYGVNYDNEPEYKQPVAIFDIDIAIANAKNLTNGVLYEYSSAQVFFTCNFLGKDFAISNSAELVIVIVFCLLVAWGAVYLGVMFGPKSIGLVTLVTVPFTFLMVIVFTFRMVTLPGSYQGVLYVLTPNFGKLAYIGTWTTAATGVFYDFMIACGVYTTYASYNRFHTDFVCDFVWVCFYKYTAAMLCVMVVGGSWGFLAHHKDLDINSIAHSGPDTVYVTMAEALSLLPTASTWSLLFYLLMFLISCNVMFALTEVIITALVDQAPRIRRFKPLVALAVCAVLFLLGLPMCTNGAFYWLQVLDQHIMKFQLQVVVVLMVVCVLYYAVISQLRYRHDMAAITKWNCCCCPSVCIWAISSLLLISATAISIFIVVVDITRSHEVYREGYPAWATKGLERAVMAFPIVGMVTAFIIHIIVALVRKDMNFSDLFRISKHWRPALPKHQNSLRRFAQSKQRGYGLMHQQGAPSYPTQQGAPPVNTYYPTQEMVNVDAQEAPSYPTQQGAPSYPTQQGAPSYPTKQGVQPVNTYYPTEEIVNVDEAQRLYPDINPQIDSRLEEMPEKTKL